MPDPISDGPISDEDVARFAATFTRFMEHVHRLNPPSESQVREVITGWTTLITRLPSGAIVELSVEQNVLDITMVNHAGSTQ